MRRLELKKDAMRLIFALYTVGIGVILFLAYSNGIPKQISIIPYYDLIGHFFLYGIWGYLAHRALNRIERFGMPIGPAIIAFITIAEELLQQLSENRTSSLSDLLFSLAGVWLAVIIDNSLKKKTV